MPGIGRGIRLASVVPIVCTALVLGGCGAAALPPPPLAATASAAVPATAVAAATSTARPTQASTAQTGNAAQLAVGRAAFTSNCGVCHMLTAAGTSGAVGPSLNRIGLLRDAAWVAAQIQNPCAPGHAGAAGPKYNCVAMPRALVSAAQAQAIAAYLASQK